MKRPWTVELGYTRHYGATVTVEADSLEEAIPAAIRYADDNERWKDTGHASDAYAVAACEGADVDPWDGPVSALPIPDRFTERGAPPVVTLTPLGPSGSIEVCGRHRSAALRRRCGHRHRRGLRPAASAGQQARGHRLARRTRQAARPRSEHGKARVRILDD